MKKITAFLIAAASVFCLTACGDVQQPVEESSEKPKRVSTSPIDPEILGTWMNDKIGYRFQEDRNVSLIMDESYYVHFEGENLIVNAMTLGSDSMSSEGDDLRFFYKYDDAETGEPAELDVLLMTRISGNGEGFDGTYRITGGVVGDDFASVVGLAAEDMDIEAEVDGESFLVTLKDYCMYETSDTSLDMFGDNVVMDDNDLDFIKYTYKIEGDTLTMTYTNDGSEMEEVYKKVK